MKISTKGRYGLRMLLQLAANYGEGYTSIQEIAVTQDISRKYLEQIISLFHKAGLVASARGAVGGYKLSMPPEKITVSRILQVTEGTLAPVSCAEDGPCQRQDDCAAAFVWQKIYQAIQQVTESITLAELLNHQK